MHSPIFFDCYIRIVYTDIIVCMHACMDVWMYGCMYVRTYVGIFVSIYYLSIYVLYCNVLVFVLYCIVCTYVCMYNIDLPLDTMHSKTSRRPVSTATACWGERPPRPHWPLHPAPP